MKKDIETIPLHFSKTKEKIDTKREEKNKKDEEKKKEEEIIKEEEKKKAESDELPEIVPGEVLKRQISDDAKMPRMVRQISYEEEKKQVETIKKQINHGSLK